MYSFSIKDLENLSGVKAHTIRIWEQRYKLLAPKRTETNIRYYDGEDLKLLLNVAMLQDLGYRISKICAMSNAEMREIIQKETEVAGKEKHLLNILKISMLNFDEELFQSVAANYLKDHTLEETFNSIFIPFMHQVGLLWQTDAICPAQEHFITNLIRQKIFCAVDQLFQEPVHKEKTYVLFLPDGEIHEIGLLMMHYILKKRGWKSVYLGTSVPMIDLQQVQQRLGDVDFVSFFTTHPSTNEVGKYMEQLIELFGETKSQFHLSGWLLKDVTSPNEGVISIYKSPEEILAHLSS